METDLNMQTDPKSYTRRIRSLAPSLKAVENAQSDGVFESPSPQNSYVVELHSSSTRQSSRKKVINKKYENDDYETSPIKLTIRKRSNQHDISKPINIIEEKDSDIDEIEDSSITKAATLFEEKLDIDGKNIYSFNTPKKRDSMLKLAMQTPKTPKTPKLNTKTPDSKRKKLLDTQSKTPCHIRNKVKKEILKCVDNNSKSDFSSDESDAYEPSSESENSSSDADNKESEDTENDVQEVTGAKSKRNQYTINGPLVPNTANTKLRKRSSDFIPESECYFNANSNKKIITSDHTLDRLKNPRLQADQIFSLLSSMKISDKHEEAIKTNLEEYKSYFNKWLFILNEGFNILCYGLGSKRRLLQNFHNEFLKAQNVLVINGFFPSLTLKDIFDGISELLELPMISSNLHEAIDYLEEELQLTPEIHIFLIIHNLDGPMLRNAKTQEVLSQLGSLPSIHLIASIDHINTPLIWDNSKLSKYNFSWWDVTTMLSYTDETAFENSLMVQNSGTLELSSMRNVFSSLTNNGRRMFILLIKYQLENKDNRNYQGMSSNDLYNSCRDALIVSSDLAAKAQLTEFLDHKLVKIKRNIDGVELLRVPIHSNLLQQFIDEQK